MKLLIITAFFPPGNSIAAHRPYSWAKYWSRAGHNVTVLTTLKKDKLENLRLSCTDFQLLEIPIPVIEPMRRLIYGTNKLENGPKYDNSQGSTSSSPRRLIRFWMNLFEKFQQKTGCFFHCRMPDFLDAWALRAWSIIKESKWDLVISTAGPYSVHWPAARSRYKDRARCWIADWRDLWIDNHIYPGVPGFRFIEERLERSWCNSADIVTTVSEPLAKVLSHKYGRNIHVVYNGFDEEDYAKLPFKCPDYLKPYMENDVRTIVYTGTIYPPYQDPTPLFKAVSQLHEEGILPADKLKIIFCGNNANIKNLAQKTQTTDFVDCIGVIPREDALFLQRQAHALLFLEFESDRIKGILTGKLFEYLYAGTPIVAIGLNDTSGPDKIIKEIRAGLSCGRDINLIKKTIHDLVFDYDNWQRKFAGKNDQRERLLNFYSRKTQAKKMLTLAMERLSAV